MTTIKGSLSYKQMNDVTTYFDFTGKELFLTHQDISPAYMTTRYINNDGYEVDQYDNLIDEYEVVDVEEMTQDEQALWLEWSNA
jgi:hypothetical protein